jgi:DNA-binding NarL/FixJ family response regulator
VRADTEHAAHGRKPQLLLVLRSCRKSGVLPSNRVPHRVLIIEDQTVLRELLVEVFAADPRYEVVGEFGDGVGALREPCRTAPDALVVDYRLPNLNGIAIAQRFMARGVKAVLLTAHDHPDLLREAVAAGIHGVVSKSAPLRVVLNAVATVVEGREYRCAATESALRQAHSVPAITLTGREREIVKLVAEGLSSKQIAERLGVTEKTVGNHRTNLMRKLGVHDVVTLTRYAIERGCVGKPKPSCTNNPRTT